MEGKVFGIDLGTTNSAIAVFDNDEAVILKNIEGDDITPSAIYFTGVTPSGDDEIIVGKIAKNAANAEPDAVVQFVKRMMGKSGPAYNFTGPSGKEYTPEMLSALILRKLCRDAEEYLGNGKVENVVITVPAYFDDARRTATKQAGKIAGLNVLRVINEPTAAAIAFGLDGTKQGKVLVYDLGGGTFDVTIMDINNGNFDVIATGGDSQLGGMNFDQKISAIIFRKLEEAGIEVDDEDDRTMMEIREKAEIAKIQLSRVELAKPFISVNGKTQRVEVSREEFEKESEDLMKRTALIVQDVLHSADMTWDGIDHLLVVGGSSRMPMVKKQLESISGMKVMFRENADPDTAVAKGAAIFGSTLSEDSADSSVNPGAPAGNTGAAEHISISDVTSQSLGVITLDNISGKDVNSIIIPKNTKIPCKKAEIFYTVVDNQSSIEIQVTEGDDTDVEYVSVIGKGQMELAPHPKNSPIEIIYTYDPDQTVFIEAIDKVTNRSLGTFEIERSSNLTEEEVSSAIKTMERTSVE